MPTLELIKEFLPFLFGSGGLIFWILARKERKATTALTEAQAKTESAKGTQEEVTALNNLDDLYTKMTSQVNKQFEKMQKNIDELEDKLSKYIEQCTPCPNNRMKK